MEGTSDVLALKMLNHELVKLDCFDGTSDVSIERNWFHQSNPISLDGKTR